MRIDVWSDVVCPWCWLGKARLEKALASFPQREHVEVVFRSFELDPRAPKDLDISSNELLAKKYSLGSAQIDALHERLRGTGLADGIDFRFDRARTSNTLEAHQVIHLARERGRQLAMVDRLFRAQFHEGVRVGDREQLVRLATDSGLDAAEVRSALDDQRFAAAVRDDQAQARALGVSGVPFFLVDGAVAVSGAQAVDVFRKLLEKGWERRPLTGADAAAGACDDDGCPV
ncbi:MAG: DsbA family oxidoreductase [Deltaproteobacteria bacterium]|nr:DsbA family oxidoreductase [Deltaproteobacteria bacterium]